MGNYSLNARTELIKVNVKCYIPGKDNERLFFSLSKISFFFSAIRLANCAHRTFQLLHSLYPTGTGGHAIVNKAVVYSIYRRRKRKAKTIFAIHPVLWLMVEKQDEKHIRTDKHQFSNEAFHETCP